MFLGIRRLATLSTAVTVLAVIVIGVMLVALSAVFGPNADSSSDTASIASTVFQVSGTMVALILPAAGLAGQYVEGRTKAWFEILRPEGQLSRRGAEIVEGLAPDVKKATLAAWNGCVYLLLSFPLASLALFNPRFSADRLHTVVNWLPHPSGMVLNVISLEDVLLSATMSLMLVGSLLLLPLAWIVLGFELLEIVEKDIRDGRALPEPVQDRQPKEAPRDPVQSRRQVTATVLGKTVIRIDIVGEHREGPGGAVTSP